MIGVTFNMLETDNLNVVIKPSMYYLTEHTSRYIIII